MSTEIVVVGAGIAGIACARRLADAGLRPLILDKGRGLGGRMATRRATTDLGAIQVDHGAQYITARGAAFVALLDRLRAAGAVAPWADGAARTHLVGLPGMSGLPRALAEGLDLHPGQTVTALRPDGAGWTVGTESDRIAAARVVVTVPAPQVAGLLGAAHPLSARIAGVQMAPCLTLMAAFAPEAPRPFVAQAREDAPLAWIAQDSSKPDRPGAATTWVAQAGPAWSARHLDADRETIAARMLPLLCERLGVAPAAARYVAAHRWRYARTTEPLGAPFLKESSGSLYLGGDWCLGARVEAAWTSGDAIARDILGQEPIR